MSNGLLKRTCFKPDQIELDENQGGTPDPALLIQALSSEQKLRTEYFKKKLKFPVKENLF